MIIFAGFRFSLLPLMPLCRQRYYFAAAERATLFAAAFFAFSLTRQPLLPIF